MEIDIRKGLKTNKIQIKELAVKIGITEQSLHYFFNRGNDISFSQLTKIADAAGISVNEFIFDDSDATEITCPHCGNKISIEVKK